MRRMYALISVLVLVILCTVANADLCTHNLSVIGERITYTRETDGHIKTVTETLSCSMCNEIGTRTTRTFEGHNYDYTGNEHYPNTRNHVSYYRCSNCYYETQVVYFCTGAPCSIMMSVPEDTVTE